MIKALTDSMSGESPRLGSYRATFDCVLLYSGKSKGASWSCCYKGTNPVKEGRTCVT